MINYRRTRVAVPMLLVLVGACGGPATSVPASPTSLPSLASVAPTAEASVETLATTTEGADEPPAGATVIHVGPGARLEPAEVTVAAAETVTFFVDSSNVEAGVLHNLKIGPAMPPALAVAESERFDREQSVVFTVSGLEPGSYAIWCSVDEHYAYGMHATLTVE